MLKKYYKENFGIPEEIYSLLIDAETKIQNQFIKIDEVANYNQAKVIKAMQNEKLSDIHFSGTTGYGYNDLGRDTLENIYKNIFNTELAIVRPQLISGTHALTTALFANLNTGDELLSPCNAPYDTLQGVIGIRKTKGSLIEKGITYKQVDMIDNKTLDYAKIEQSINKKTKLVLIQRSKGYSFRNSLEVEEIKELISFIKSIKKDAICMVDNCYGEFVEIIEPSDVGADLVVGSLIKNIGGGIAPVGGYICGKEEPVLNCADRLSAPGLGLEVGPSLGMTSPMLQGLFLAPNVVGSSLKTAIVTSQIFDTLGYEVNPKPTSNRTDIVQAIKFNNEEKVIKFCEGIQKGSAVDSFVIPKSWQMPGYDSKVIMASGSFVQGSSIELSADAPIIKPYIAYMQGGLTYSHGRLGILIALTHLHNNNLIKL